MDSTTEGPVAPDGLPPHQAPTVNDEEPEVPAPFEHINIKVSDNNNEVYFKLKRTTRLEKMMTAFCQRQAKDAKTVRFMFDGVRILPESTPEIVSTCGEPTLIPPPADTIHSALVGLMLKVCLTF